MLSKKRSGPRARKKTTDPNEQLSALDLQNPRPAELADVAVVESVQLPPLPASDYSVLPLENPPVSDPRAVVPAPVFGHTLLSAAFRYIKPTWRNYIQYVDMEARTGNESARRFVSVWRSLPVTEQRTHLPEQICELAGVSANNLVSWVSGQVWLEGSAQSAMVMAFRKSEVMEQTAAFALQSPDNYKHAELFLKASGALPQSARQGVSPAVNIFNTPFAPTGAVSGTAAALTAAAVPAVTAPSLALDMDQEIINLAQVMQSERNDDSFKPLHEPDDEPEEEEEEEEEEYT